MSGIYFRVFENLNSEENDPARFKLDIMVNHGALLPDNLSKIKEHCIPINLMKSFSQTLTLEDIDNILLQKDITLCTKEPKIIQTITANES